MKVLIANPPALFPLADGMEKYFIRAGSRWPAATVKKRETPIRDFLPFPFYLAYSAAMLRDDGFDVTAVDAVALNWTEDEFVAHVHKEKPDVLLLESTTPTIKLDVEVLRRIKGEMPELITCIAGSHVSTFPKDTLEMFPEINFIFMGEYEQPFLNFARHIREHGRDYEGLRQKEGIAFIEDGQLYCGPKGLNRKLDELPFPAWDLFPMVGENAWEYYWDNICTKKPAVQMHASRGCNMRCDFCVWIQVMYSNSTFRGFGADRIIDEMEELIKRYGAEEVYFDDDMFTGNKKHVMNFCQRIKERGVKVKWSVMGDAMICDEAMLEAMADAGCIAIKFGVESGDERVLKEINKPVKHDKVLKFCKKANQLGIKTHATFSFGLSGETRESMQKTYEFMKKLDVDTIQVSITTPFPGTKFYQKAKERGHLTSEEWELFDGNHTSVIRYDNLSNEEIQAFATSARTRWLRSRLYNLPWLYRQSKIVARIARSQGLGGIKKLFGAGYDILRGEKSESLKLIQKTSPA